MSSRSKKKNAAIVPWTPFEKCTAVTLTDGRTVPIEEIGDTFHIGLTGVWRNSRYQVWVSELKTPLGLVTHLSIKRNDRKPVHDWRDLQRIKNELCAPEREAMEIYPAESRLVDTANQFHLWVLAPGVQVPIGFFDGRLVNDNESPGLSAKQRPYEEDNRPVNQMVPETLEEAQELIARRLRERAIGTTVGT
jgi:hypothetical protein